jgi:hypothetical protein
VKDPLSHTAVVIMIHSRRQPQHRCRVCDFYLLPAPTPSDHSISANTYFYTFSIIGAEYLTKKKELMSKHSGRLLTRCASSIIK